MGGWKGQDVAVTIAVFALAGLCEIGGGWLVWQAVREVCRPLP
jgi:small multidrug resistance family-3 protein